MKEWKASELDIRCSEACTRAGLTALLVSALAFSMLPLLAEQEALDALEKYMALRLSLESALDNLDGEPCWEELKGKQPSGQDPDTWSLSLLVEVVCTFLPPTLNPQPTSAAPTTEPSPPWGASMPGKRPAPPTNVRLMVSLYRIHDIADSLIEITDTDLLSRARNSSSYFNYSIFRWELLLDQTITRNSSIPVVRISSQESIKKTYVRSYSPEHLLKYLTLKNVRELAAYELPNISDIESPIAQRRGFSWSLTTPPFNLLSATMFVEMVLIFALAYFWFFCREARRSETFLAPGTLFGVVNRTCIARAIFFILTLTPAAAASLLAYRSYSKVPWNILFAAFVVWFVCLIRRESKF